MNLPIYTLSIDDNDLDTGVDVISIVEQPAIGVAFLKLNKEVAHKFEVVDEDKRILTGAILVADLPIYRNNKQFGEHYVVFDSKTIEKIAQKFFKRGHQLNVNLNHDPEQPVNNVFFYESFLINRKRGINPPKGFETLSDGSWFGTLKVEDDKMWEFVKNDKNFTGFSIEGIFQYNEEPDNIDDIYMQIEELIKNALSE